MSWQFVACWVLPNFTRIAATRLYKCIAHSPCFQSHARLAEHITMPAGGLLPHPFSPYRSKINLSTNFVAGILSVAVVVKYLLPNICPHLRFHEATILDPYRPDGSREVPLLVFRTSSDGFLFNSSISDIMLLNCKLKISKR